MVPGRLRQARQKAKMTQEKLGVLVGIDESTARSRISYYESGRRAPSFSTACAIARVLDIPEGYLYTQDDDLAEGLLILYRAKKCK